MHTLDEVMSFKNMVIYAFAVQDGINVTLRDLLELVDDMPQRTKACQHALYCMLSAMHSLHIKGFVLHKALNPADFICSGDPNQAGVRLINFKDCRRQNLT